MFMTTSIKYHPLNYDILNANMTLLEMSLSVSLHLSVSLS